MLSEIYRNRINDYIKNNPQKFVEKDVYIYGTGNGADIVYEVLKKNHITCIGRVVIKHMNTIEDNRLPVPVVSIDEITIKPDYLIILAIVDLNMRIIADVLTAGVSKDKLIIVGENNWKTMWEDTVYRKCKVGRGTYGYEELLANDVFCPVEKIGRFTSINSTARVWGNHPTNYVSTHPLFFYPYSDEKTYIQDTMDDRLENLYVKNYSKPIQIGNDVWIGANVVIMPHVNIGDGAVIAAGAVVTKDVEPYSIVGGGTGSYLKVSV